jgi:hypothetical protein
MISFLTLLNFILCWLIWLWLWYTWDDVTIIKEDIKKILRYHRLEGRNV